MGFLRIRINIRILILAVALQCFGGLMLRGAETSQPASGRVMTLKECVIIALQQAYDLQIQTLSVDAAISGARAADASYEPSLAASLTYRDTTEPGGIDTRTGEFSNSQTNTTSSSVSVNGLLPTGATYSVGASISDTEGDRGGSAFSNASGQGPFIQIRQPLMENFAIDDARLNIEASRQNLKISEFQLHQSILQIVNRVEDAYYDLIAARENVRVQESAVQLADQLWQENQKRVALGALAPIEEAEARSQAATAKASLLSSKQAVAAAQNVLKGIMVDDFAQWQAQTILPKESLTETPATLDFNASWDQAMVQRPDLRILQLQLEQRTLIERRRQNQTMPNLDLTAGAGLRGSSRELSGVFDQVQDREAPFYSLGLSLTLPLGNRREKENFRSAQIATEQARLRLKQQRQVLMVQLDNAVNQAKIDIERIDATRKARVFAEQALANEQGKLARGASTNFIVLQLQRNLTAARSSEIRSVAGYNRSLSRLRLLEGSNLAPHQVFLSIAE